MVITYVFLSMIGGLAIIGTIFMVFGIVLKNRATKALKICTEKTPGTVVNLVATNYEHIGIGEVRMEYWTPVYEYYVEGEKYIKLSNVGRDKDSIKIGEEVTLYYNPNNPKEIFIPRENISKIASIFQKISVGLAIVIVILLIVMITLNTGAV